MRPRVDQGKFAKEMKALRPNDARKLDARERLPPHKKARTYLLSVEWTRTETIKQTRAFTNKAARDEARRRWEKDIKEKGGRYSYWWASRRDIVREIETGPTFTESDLSE